MSIFDSITYKLKELGWIIQRWFTSKSPSDDQNNLQLTTNKNSIVIPAEGYIMGIGAIGVTTIFALGLTYHLLSRKTYSTVNQNDPENPARE